jgi:hypothetical protein
MYYMDADTIDGTTSYFPGTNGLAYWNESMGPDSAQIIAYSFDYDESGTLDFEDEIAAYFVGCAAFPSIATDASGAMYITYSAIMENFSTGAQNYRHQFVVHSTDGGVTWNTEDACDLTPDIDFDGYEAVFGSIAPDVVDGWRLSTSETLNQDCTFEGMKIQSTSTTSCTCVFLRTIWAIAQMLNLKIGWASPKR